ncbi:MAG: YajG family lipoprotein [Gammaproteobacteria bacterium]
MASNDFRHRARIAAGAAAIAILAAGGCALSPQMVALNPAVQSAPVFQGNGRTLALAVEDRRPQAAFGTRGGIYGTTSEISPGTDVSGAVRAALAGRLSGAGFAVQPPGAPGQVDMRVAINAIDYAASGSPAVNAIDLGANMDLTVSLDGNTYRGDARVSERRSVLTAPTAQDNEQFLNEIVGRAIDRLLANPDLATFLSKTGSE